MLRQKNNIECQDAIFLRCNNLETKLKALKNNENDLEIISDYTKRLDLINRQHHTNNYE